MRTVDQDLADAILAPERTVRARLSCDWDGDGHGAAGSLDDLSDKAATIKVASVLQGTQPEQVNVVEGTSAATIDVDLAKGDTDDDRRNAVRFFAPTATTSPLAGKEKLNRDLHLDVEFLTAAGWQSVPLLRGISRGLSARVASRTAELSGLDYRTRLRTPVVLPAMAADVPEYGNLFPTKPGMESTWIASYALSACGYPMSPPPRDECRLFVPMHGSAMAFVSEPYMGSRASRTWDAGLVTTVGPVEFGPGPFILATQRQSTLRQVQMHHQFADGAPMFASTGRSAGRLEMWVAPSVDDWDSTTTVDVFTFDTILCQVTYTVNGSVNQLQLTNDAVTRTINGPAFPRDGAWHQAGVHWDDAAGSAVFCVDGALTTVAFTPTPVTSGGTDSDAVVEIATVPPMAELHVTTGITAATSWQPTTYTQPAVLDRLQNRLDGIVPGAAMEGWLILQELAAAEQGAVWLDPDGRPHVASRARLVSTAAQVPQRTVDATADMFDLAYDYHLDKVVNIVTAAYQAITVAVQAKAWSLGATVQLAAQQSVTILASYNGLATSQRFFSGTANTKSDGTGTQYTYGDLITVGAVKATITYTSDTTATIVITNTLSSPVWLVDTSGNPNVIIEGDAISQAAGPDPAVVTNAASRDKYGDQPLTMPDNRWVQKREFAWGVAMATAGDLAQPAPVFADIPIPGDPRLEPFDRLTVQDPDNTELHTDVWYVGGTHTIEATGQYTQQLVARPARDRFLAGSGLVGVDLVG